MQNEIAIKVANLSKSYKLYDKPIDRLKESLHPFGRKYHKEFYALKDVGFEIKRGETIGIIGKNGSGKSTLLKMLTGVVTPTAGTIEVNGKISALLELGAGFNPEFTGIENIYMNGTIMGYSKAEMDTKLQRILDFADIGDFVHQPVKMYSSGMFARLAFAVAINVEPDILIVDEALSVGDVFFQNKCYRKFAEMRANDTTILFVSHDLGAVKMFCEQVLWLKDGELFMYGDREEVCSAYMNYQFDCMNEEVAETVANLQEELLTDIHLVEKTTDFPPLELMDESNLKHSDEAEIIAFFVRDQHRKLTQVLEIEKEYTAHIVGKFHTDMDNVILGFLVDNNKGITVLGFNTYLLSKKIIRVCKDDLMEVVFTFKLPRIRQGQYLASPAIAKGNQDNHVMLTWLHSALKLEIINTGFNISLMEIDFDFEVKKYTN